MRTLNEDIKVFGLFGYPLGHSYSPIIQNAALRATGVPGMYFAFERNPKRFLKLLRSKKKMILDGFNLTVPFKETIVPFVNRLDPVARLTGAVNTVKREGDLWIGYNTDVHGFSAGLKQARFRPKGKRAVVLGAGGAARAVLASLALSNIKEVYVLNRTKSRAQEMVGRFRRKFPRAVWNVVSSRLDLKNALQTCDLLVNATRVGLKQPEPILIPKSCYPKKKMLVYDLIYGSKPTRLLREARKGGHRTLNGETMLLHQGARAFQIWTGKKAPVSIMREELHRAIRSH